MTIRRTDIHRWVTALTLFGAVVSPVFCQGQQITPDPAMASAPQPPISIENFLNPPKVDKTHQPPRVNADHSVTFHLVSPHAEMVELVSDMEPKPLLMSRDTNGVWTVTTSAAQPEIYTYHFNVDGESVLDPSNRWHKPSLLHQDNLFEVPGEQAQLWDRTTAPHGSVTHHYFQSAAIAVPSEYYVYTPPGYDAESRAKYPVLYLLHGYSDGANAWLEIGRVNFILDNLIAQRRAKPMIVVMPLGYGAPEVLTNQASFFNSHVAIRLYSAFRDSLFNEVMPRVARAYRVLTGPSSTAIAGLSMGGGESLVIGVGHPEKFGYVGSFSGAFVGKNPEDSDFMWKAPRKLLWIACGDSDLLVGDSNKSMRLWLEEHGVQATFATTLGGHQWPVWRDNLASFVPLLFR